MADARRARRLGQLAGPLRPERAPYYVRRPLPPSLERSFPAEGWYWVPHGHQFAVFLGASFETAAAALRDMLREP